MPLPLSYYILAEIAAFGAYEFIYLPVFGNDLSRRFVNRGNPPLHLLGRHIRPAFG